MKKISHLAPRKTYGEQATILIAEELNESYELTPLVSHKAVAESVISKKADLGVIAYYNFLEGLVQENLDFIYELNLNIIGSKRLPIMLSIGGNSPEKIYSHPKALAQSSDYLWNNYPDVPQIPTSSTAAATEKVKKEGSGLAIASKEAIEEYGLELIMEDIGNKKGRRNNFTDFYLIARENGVDCNPEKEYLTMVAITPHNDKAGLLADITSQIAFYGINNAKIHSRPALDDVGDISNLEPQMFYLEMMCHKDEERFRRCVDSLKYGLTPVRKDVDVIRVLGSYERPRI